MKHIEMSETLRKEFEEHQLDHWTVMRTFEAAQVNMTRMLNRLHKRESKTWEKAAAETGLNPAEGWYADVRRSEFVQGKPRAEIADDLEAEARAQDPEINEQITEENRT